jgi:hypothetical protein
MPARTVRLELLRHGPAHNQLLSPLTAYLALCGNHDAETVHVGFEHVQLLRRMRELRYREGRATEGRAERRAALDEAAEEVTRFLSSIRALAAEMSSAPLGDKRLIHLRLTLSASELSLLPFELARSPAGFPGQGQWLSLQTAAPIVITREARRVAASTIRWPEKPRILVIAASPAGLPEVPLRAHLLALRKALEPWLLSAGHYELTKHVTVLPSATLAEVRAECAKAAIDRPYTHVHILAHGLEDPDESDGMGARYGLALCSDADRDKRDIVTGSRLAAALRCQTSEYGDGELSTPAVVTIASCDSGNVGSVLSAGASLAHDLHEAGVPMVLASQFPLSMKASVILADVVYSDLLHGGDPRAVVHKLRQRLHVECRDTHDWASVVVYAALPDDIDAQVQRAKLRHPIATLSAALSRRDLAAVQKSDALDATVKDIERSIDTLAAAVRDDRGSPDVARARGVLGNAGKRLAHALHGGPLWPLVAEPAPEIAGAAASAFRSTSDEPRRQAEARRRLEEARSAYFEAFRGGINEAWPLVQYLALSVALWPLDRELPESERADEVREITRWWTFAQFLAEDNLRNRRGPAIAWAHSALVELAVLAQVLPADHPARVDCASMAWEHLHGVIQTGSEFDKYSLRRQLRRYADWWWSGPAHEHLRKLPAALDERLAALGIAANLFVL